MFVIICTIYFDKVLAQWQQFQNDVGSISTCQTLVNIAKPLIVYYIIVLYL